MLRIALAAGLGVAAAAAQAQDRGSAYQLIDRRCENLLQRSADDMASLAELRITLPAMCQCIASTMTAKLLDSELASLSQPDNLPPRVEALWAASRGFCAVALKPRP